MAKIELEEFAPTKEAAKILGISIKTLWRMRVDGNLPKQSWLRFRGAYRYNVQKIAANSINK